MLIVHTQKYLRMSPQKLRLVVSMIKKMPIERAIISLPFSRKRAAEPVAKVLKAALAIAKEKGIPPDRVSIKEIQINEGPRLKRGMPVSRGRWHPIVKKMSHIRVVLETTGDAKKANDKKENSEKTEKIRKTK